MPAPTDDAGGVELHERDELHAFQKKESELAHEYAACAANVNWLEHSESPDAVLLAEWRARLETSRHALLAHLQPVG